MGRSKNGILGNVHGKVARVVFYELNGQDVIRSLGDKKRQIKSETVKANNQSMALLMDFFSGIKPYLKAGFKNEAQGTIYNFHNLATSYNKINAIEVIDYIPQLKFENLLLSRGIALLPDNPTVQLLNGMLKFSWNTDPELAWITNQDQVMMLAWFPEINEAIFNIAGAVRSAGTDHLELPPSYRTLTMHLYISFVAEDRESVSNSLYLGRIN